VSERIHAPPECDRPGAPLAVTLGDRVTDRAGVVWRVHAIGLKDGWRWVELHDVDGDGWLAQPSDLDGLHREVADGE
jgi:hypothetical protein